MSNENKPKRPKKAISWIDTVSSEEYLNYSKEDLRINYIRAGNITEITVMQKHNDKPTIKRRGKDTYIVLSDESKTERKFNFKENRAESTDSMQRTLRRLRLLINNNFFGEPNELMLTLTYAENMKDTQRLYEDFNKFMKRLRYYCQNTHENAPFNIEYLTVVEPQARGAWHHHTLIKSDCPELYIHNSVIAGLWGRGQGFTKTTAITNVDNVGAYLSAYLANIEVADDIEGENVIKKNGKKYVKGARLHFYPSGTNLYRHSKGIKMPNIIKNMPYSKAMKLVEGHTKTGEYDIEIEKDGFTNLIHKEYYNAKRRPTDHGDQDK